MKYYIIKESDMVDIADAIRAKRGTNELLSVDQMKTEIPDITTDSSADYVRYVTFRNESTGEEFVKSVAIGDDCVDVVANGLWPTPTRESDAQYDYTFYGWGASDDGAADADILKNVTEDKTVYAIYTKTVKYYTITYYDEDGTTVLKTETLAYGTVPSYKPTKEGYLFIGWTPAPAAVTGDASYTSTGWKEGYSFAKSSWADIAAVSEAGEAQQYFKIGDTREENLGYPVYNTTLMIIGFNHDNLADGSGKAGITIGMVTASDGTYSLSSNNYQDNDYSLPAEIAAVAKKATYIVYNGWDNAEKEWSTAQMVLFDWTELNLTNNYLGASSSIAYQAVKDGVFPQATNTYSGTTCAYWLRGEKKITPNVQKYYADSSVILNGRKQCSYNIDGDYHIRGHFCV